MKKLIKLNSIIALIAVVFLASCTKNEVTKVTISNSNLALYVGQTDSLYAEADYTGDIVPSVTWSSSNPVVVSINGGEIEALKAGTATITATAGDKAATCIITVTDQINTTFTSGGLAYWGDYYEGGISNNYQVYLMNNSNDTLVLEFNTSLSAVDNIPSGNYTMVDTQDYTTFSDYIPNTLVAYNFDYGYGSMFFNKNFATGFVEGGAVVTNTNKNYKIEYSIIDYMGNTLTGTYTGALEFYDGTQSATVSAAKISKKSLSKRMILKR